MLNHLKLAADSGAKDVTQYGFSSWANAATPEFFERITTLAFNEAIDCAVNELREKRGSQKAIETVARLRLQTPVYEDDDAQD